MAGFGADAIAPVTQGLIRSTGNFSERMVSAGYIGDILTTPSALSTARKIVMTAWRIIKRRLSQQHKGI